MASFAPTQEKANGTRLRRLLLDGGTQVLRNVFNEIHPPGTLEGVFKAHEKHLRRKCFASQLELLFPKSGSPCSSSFDISLLCLLLRDICGITAPHTGWESEPSEFDRSRAANIVRIRRLRNQYQHCPSSNILQSNFEQLWQEMSAPLIDLGMLQEDIDKLKTSPIEDLQSWHHKLHSELEKTALELHNFTRSLQYNVSEKPTKQYGTLEPLQSCVPDAPPNFIGREEIYEIIMKDEGPLVVVHGMAGIGKSSLVKKVAWDLHHQFEKTVFYVDLWRCKPIEEDISKTIVTVLRRSKVAMNPVEALDIWVKNLKQDVILVLDNAEDVLTHGSPHESGIFEKILLKVRQFSRQKVRFLVASRETLSVDLPMKEIKMDPMTAHEGVQVINKYLPPRCTHLEEVIKQTLAELCFNIPLNLMLVVSLLEDFEAEELIEILQSNKLTVLDRLQQAVSLSFNKLNDKQRSIFVAITVFPAHFTASAAAAVIEVGKLNTVGHLNALCRMSLLQKADGKYFLHPFIHEYAIEYGKRCAKNQLKKAEENFVNHYQSLLLENATLFWTKDKCKASLNRFYDDRTNITTALEKTNSLKLDELEKTRWAKQEVLENSMTSLVRYLENCISWDLLQKLIETILKLVEKKHLISQQIELVCWNAHFSRRKSDHKKYNKLVKQAQELHDAASKANLPCSTEICYKISEANHIAVTNGKDEDIIKVLKDAVKICKANTEVSPMVVVDYARAVGQLAHHAKTVDGNQCALETLQKHQTLDICLEKLGEHIHTALCLKDLSDRNIDLRHFEEALNYNDKALEMFNNLNCGQESPVVLLFKNRGTCYRNIGKYKECKECLLKANEIANNITSEGSTYSFWINAELAILYDTMNDIDRAKAIAKDAIEIATKRKFTRSHWRKYEAELDKIMKK